MPLNMFEKNLAQLKATIEVVKQTKMLQDEYGRLSRPWRRVVEQAEEVIARYEKMPW